MVDELEPGDYEFGIMSDILVDGIGYHRCVGGWNRVSQMQLATLEELEPGDYHLLLGGFVFSKLRCVMFDEVEPGEYVRRCKHARIPRSPLNN
jgi:hypothetical protein